jgi:CheY-like chemotaxis protein
MDESTRLRIFEPFFTTKSKGKGTGLGMPVVYGLMQSHNGLVDVVSQVGKGTSISLFFPIPKDRLPDPVEQPKVVPTNVEGTETVLIVDDEADVRYFLEVILKARGYRVLSARDAEEAIELLQSHPEEVHILFSDLGLPKLDGFGLSRRAKSLKPGLKTILTSGYADGSLKTRLVESGIEGFISKPYEVASLLQSLRAILDKR